MHTKIAEIATNEGSVILSKATLKTVINSNLMIKTFCNFGESCVCGLSMQPIWLALANDAE